LALRKSFEICKTLIPENKKGGQRFIIVLIPRGDERKFLRG